MSAIINKKNSLAWLRVWSVFFGFLGFHYLMGTLHYPHLLFGLTVILLFGLHSNTRLFILLMLPILLQNVFFDAFRLVPFHWYLPIHIEELYKFDQTFFSIAFNGKTYLPHEFFNLFQHPYLDFVSGLLYNALDPIVVIMVIVLWVKRGELSAARYALAFLLMNFFAFTTYFFYPAAAPWYVAKYGFVQPLGPIPGDPAGLARFDQMLGLGVSNEFYSMSPVVFGALPSMHAGFMMLVWLYSLKLSKKWYISLGLAALGMWVSALYLQHHYLVDVLLGIVYALVAWAILEKMLPHWGERIFGFKKKILFYPEAPCFFGKK